MSTLDTSWNVQWQKKELSEQMANDERKLSSFWWLSSVNVNLLQSQRVFFSSRDVVKFPTHPL